MKVCIVTWFNSQNYGTCLQGFALYHYLKKQGYDDILLNTKIYIDYKKIKYFPVICSRIIEHMKGYLKDGKKIKERKKIRDKYLEHFRKRDNLFIEFKEKNLKVTESLSKEKLVALSKDMDAFVTGSDQIWNPYYLKDRYLLDFVSDDTKKIAYSSSFGVSELRGKRIIKKYKKYLSRFNAISVREKTGVDICNTLGIMNAQRVVDPTLLLSKNEWEGIIKRNNHSMSLPTEEYILCYFVGDSLDYWNYINKVAERTSYNIKVIPFSNSAYKSGYDLCIETGPLEFIKLIMNAKYIYTDSFHCTCFSIIFNRQFTVLRRFAKEDYKSQNSRLDDLFSMLNMKSRICDFDNVLLPEDSEFIEFESINERLAVLVGESERYLLESLEV